MLANLCGHDSHGVGILPLYVDSIVEGVLKPNRHVSVLAGAVEGRVADPEHQDGDAGAAGSSGRGLVGSRISTIRRGGPPSAPECSIDASRG